MSQSLSFKGYRVSGAATEYDGKWSATYEIQKPSEPLRRCNFVIEKCSIAAAENEALLRGVAEVNGLTDDVN